MLNAHAISCKISFAKKENGSDQQQWRTVRDTGSMQEGNNNVEKGGQHHNMHRLGNKHETTARERQTETYTHHEYITHQGSTKRPIGTEKTPRIR